MSETKRIAALLFEGADLLDATGPLAVFSSAALHAPVAADAQRPYEVEFISMNGGPLTTEQGLVVHTTAAAELRQGDYDTVIVAGGDLHSPGEEDRVAWIQRNHICVRRIASVCLGAFTLAKAGLLDGLRATTHWNKCAALRRQFRTIEVCDDAIFIPGEHVWTSAGVTSGIDMALAMVEEDHGRQLALTVARFQVVFLKRPGGQSQFSASLRSQAAEGPLAPLLDWMAHNPTADLRTETLAQRAGMSLRNFFRSFVDATGSPPAEWVEALRLEVAKQLLEQTEQTAEQIAYRSGFGAYERMRKTFGRRLGVTPGQYRERFCLAKANATDLDIGTRVRNAVPGGYPSVH